MSRVSNAEVVIGSLSMVSCTLVLTTYVVFKDIRKLTYMELIMYVTLNDLIASAGFAVGSNDNFTFQCIFQAFVTNFNYLSSLFWSTAIAYKVITVSTHKGSIIIKFNQQVWLSIHQLPQSNYSRYTHAVCWGIPLVVTLLPLSTNMYGKSDDDNAWCFITNRSDSPKWGILVWELCGFYVWLWISIILNSILVVSVLLRLREMGSDLEECVKWQVSKLCLYPVVSILCWSLPTAMDLYIRSSRYSIRQLPKHDYNQRHLISTVCAVLISRSL